jgi:hypothetical protein
MSKRLLQVSTPTAKKYNTPFRSVILELNKSALDIKGIELNKTEKCNDLVAIFKGINAKELETKWLNFHREGNIWLRQKQVEGKDVNRVDAIKKQGSTATVLSTISRYIKANKVIDSKTTYFDIKKHFAPAKVDDLTKRNINSFKQLTPANQKMALDLLKKWKQKQNETMLNAPANLKTGTNG